MSRRRALGAPLLLPLFLFGGPASAVVVAVLLSAVVGSPAAAACGADPAAGLQLGPAGGGETVGASEYGGPGDPSSGVIGSSGVDLLREPDSYAELGGTSFATARAMGGLPYGTPLRITWGVRSTVAYKRDVGLGGGPIAGYPRVIDLWWELAGALHIPYEHGEWSGPVRVERAPATGAAGALGALPATTAAATPSGAGAGPAPGPGTAPGCPGTFAGGVPLAAGPHAELLPDGQAAAPAAAPAQVKAMVAAGNQIAGRPYLYGAAHGVPLDVLWPEYDCSSSVDHILWGGGFLPTADTAASGELEAFGQPGPGRWVTLYANADHVFMYVAGLRWDTWDAAGPGDGSTGIGWHPLVRDAAGFVARHPVGL